MTSLPDPGDLIVYEGFTFIGNAMTRVDEAVPGQLIWSTVALFSCDDCGAISADQEKHKRWHEGVPR